MAKEIDRLGKLLEDWHNNAGEKTIPAEKSGLILELAEKLLKSKKLKSDNHEFWHNYLNITGQHTFLQCLDQQELRYRWADTAAKAIEVSEYTLLDMFKDRLATHPEKTLFQDMAGEEPSHWSYQVCNQRIRNIAAAFLKTNETPRVAIVSDNCMESALCDLACLFYDILDTPLNVHFDVETLTWIMNRLKINIVVTDSEEHRKKLIEVNENVTHPFELFTLRALSANNDLSRELFRDICVNISQKEIDHQLNNRTPKKLSNVATVMFTSGSTGKPKGISFSGYNLITKRFARAAALPEVGDNEVLLCYLPLYHTFGRYFEMLGSIYWGGTYVLPGNPSTETFMTLLTGINPTGLISIPLRWQQMQERCLEKTEQVSSYKEKTEEIRKIIGSRLRWGLSAAGYLAPNIFRFFNKNGVALCSGFGMTEATGGITMTPPGEYVDNSIGVPLPLIRAQLTSVGEFQVAGSYLARYLDDVEPGDEIPIVNVEEDEQWLSTGDIFKILENGHYRIIDRLKDIYKNNKGQTIAPQQIEKKFDGVPGIKRTFLVGDAREFNVLLIVPNREDAIIQGFLDTADIRKYFHQIVTNANQDLAVYERIINFEVLDRDFDVEQGELTSKGSLQRKNIEAHFKESINELYQSKYIELIFDSHKIRIPRWFFRDMGILEDTIEARPEGLFNIRDKTLLPLAKTESPDFFRIGDLIYEVTGSTIDLGILVHQPSLWMGNPSLIAFSPCKDGWDVPLKPFTGRVFILSNGEGKEPSPVQNKPIVMRDANLSITNLLITNALFGAADIAIRAVNQLGRDIGSADERVARVIRQRLVALAQHSDFKIRSLAYRTLLMDEPSLDYGRTLPAFIESGLPFLDKDSIAAIASSDIKMRRLQELRRRLYNYRTKMKWPVSDTIRQQFDNMLKLLTDFARYHPQYYDTVRCELASWILHKVDPQLSKTAEEYLSKLLLQYEENLSANSPQFPLEFWESRIVFGDELTRSEKSRLKEVLLQTTFLKQSVILAFSEDNFEIDHVPPNGIWVSRIISRRRYLRYRVSINTTSGKHFDLQVVLSYDVKKASVLETIYWLMAISSYPYGARVLPRLGCCRPELRARSLVYWGQLTAWEKMREFSEYRQKSSPYATVAVWRKLFVRGLTAFFKGWQISGRRIIPGAVTPENLVVPNQDFREGATILSLTGWRKYKDTLSLVEPMLNHFFNKTSVHYPWCKDLIDVRWIFDACIEELGLGEGRRFLLTLKDDLSSKPIEYDGAPLINILEDYLNKLEKEFYVPMPLQSAIDRYHEWAEINFQATHEACEQIIGELYRLYRLDRFPEIVRYRLYRDTYFAKADKKTLQAFDILLGRMFSNPEISAMQMIELSELQATIETAIDRIVFSQILFPRASRTQQLEIIAVGESEHKQVMVKTVITDKRGERYGIREPIEPAEIGQLYRLFFKEGYPKTVTERDRLLLVLDSQDQIVGGLCYRFDGEDIVHLDGSVITPASMGNGIGSALLEDFCDRMAGRGVRIIKTHFFLRKFYANRGFNVDSRWGALVRFLDTPTRDNQ